VNGVTQETFPSKIDTWLAVIVTGAVGLTWLAPFRRLADGRAIDALDIIAPVLVTAFAIWIFTGTYYVLTSDTLFVRGGPVRRTIPLRSVQRLRATREPYSSPALSLDRIEVTYGSKRVLISPRDKRGFVSAVQRRTPGVVLEGLSV
jgi:hypothetical protein